jgi:hypothetical protein
MRKAGKAGRLYATSIKKAEPWGSAVPAQNTPVLPWETFPCGKELTIANKN